MKAYKRYSAAKNAASGRPIISISANKYSGDKIYIVGDFVSYDQISIHRSDGLYVGNVGLSHLDRMGNANHLMKLLKENNMDNTVLDWDEINAMTKAGSE